MGGKTMKVIKASSVHDAYRAGLTLFDKSNSSEWTLLETRNGPARVMNDPVTTEYRFPMNRVLLDKVRDANPFFHLFESLWILAGRRDVAFLKAFNKKIADYADNPEFFHGAYGYRLCENSARGEDQITTAIQMLKKNKYDRRIMLQIWNSEQDLGQDSKDIPCNDMIKLRVSNYGLDIIVFNRSNDMIWGAYGANVVQFSMLQEYIAAAAELPVGRYYQISSDFHVYEDVYTKLLQKYDDANSSPMKEFLESKFGSVQTKRIEDDPVEQFDVDLYNMFDSFDVGGVEEILKTEFVTSYFNTVVRPMMVMWNDYKQHRIFIDRPTNIDWLVAGRIWVENRLAKGNA